VSSISQNHPGIIEIKGLKTSHFQEIKIAPLDLGKMGSMGHVECPLQLEMVVVIHQGVTVQPYPEPFG
jgi:hypothetical protein